MYFCAPEVVVHVEDVGEEALGGLLLHLELLHAVGHEDGLAGDGLAGPVHPEDPRHPLEEERPHPVRHLVRLGRPVVVVEDDDGEHHRGGHHHHDAVEVGAWKGEGRRDQRSGGNDLGGKDGESRRNYYFAERRARRK